MLDEKDIQNMKDVGIRMLDCSVCGCEIPNTRTHNAYYGYDQYRYGDEGLCEDCLNQALLVGTNPPHYVIDPFGHKIRAGKTLTLPFFNGMWFVIRCE